MTQALILDFDGVICQTETFKLDQMAVYFRELGLQVEPRRLYQMAGGTYMEKEQVLDRIFIGQPRYREVKELALNFHTAPFPYSALLTPGITQTLETVRSRGISMGVASNSRQERLRSALESCGILSFFKYTESAFDLGMRKPDPWVYTHIMEKIGVKPQSCIIIEDSTIGIEAGKASGARVVALRDRDGAIDQSMADYIITRIEDILNYL